MEPCGDGRTGGWRREGFMEEITCEPSHGSVLKGRTLLSDRKERSDIPCRKELLNGAVKCLRKIRVHTEYNWKCNRKGGKLRLDREELLLRNLGGFFSL